MPINLKMEVNLHICNTFASWSTEIQNIETQNFKENSILNKSEKETKAQRKRKHNKWISSILAWMFKDMVFFEYKNVWYSIKSPCDLLEKKRELPALITNMVHSKCYCAHEYVVRNASYCQLSIQLNKLRSGARDRISSFK